MKLIEPRRFGDHRGWFQEVWSRPAFAAAGIDVDFVQDNHSLSRAPFVLRGLHFQAPPQAQAKLVRCLRGRIYDVAVDIRRDSPSYGQAVGVELSAENGRQLFVPAGFAHGFLTLEPDTEVAYKVSDVYAPATEGGIAWNDPALKIDWPLPPGVTPVVSERDDRWPALRDLATPFAYDGKPLQPLSR